MAPDAPVGVLQASSYVYAPSSDLSERFGVGRVPATIARVTKNSYAVSSSVNGPGKKHRVPSERNCVNEFAQ
jgi:hypothetical protein